MNSRLYVGNLPDDINKKELKDLFRESGPVEAATVITDSITHKSKGHGYVKMKSEAAAQEAIKMFNGKEYGGNILRVYPSDHILI